MNRFSVLPSENRIVSFNKKTAVFKVILATFALALSTTVVAESLQEVLKSRVVSAMVNLHTCIEKLERYPKKMADRTTSEAVDGYIKGYLTAYGGSRILNWKLWNIDLEEVERERETWTLLVFVTEQLDRNCQCNRETLKRRKREPVKLLKLVEEHKTFVATMREYARKVKQLTGREIPKNLVLEEELLVVGS